ncbi:MAG: helix-turn-helix transcriptional regulator [Candidatus Omnitrophica bacterium]|nr:helix-turn-helix transcriptional regulator [Candidatus Omnitrophota bacterium]
MLIGKRLKELREKNKMSLTDLSQKSGVQIATLSRIENMKMTGTLESHLNIAKALSVDLVELYDNLKNDEQKAEPPHVNKPQTSVESFTYNDRASYEILTSQLLKKKMLPIILRIEPDGKTNTEQNPSGSERFIFILEGEVTAYIGKEHYALKTNSSLYFDASVEHHFENKGKKAVKVISVITPVML